MLQSEPTTIWWWSSMLPGSDTPSWPRWPGGCTLSSNSKSVTPTSGIARAFSSSSFLVQLTNHDVHSGHVFYDALHYSTDCTRLYGTQAVTRLHTLTQHLLHVHVSSPASFYWPFSRQTWIRQSPPHFSIICSRIEPLGINGIHFLQARHIPETQSTVSKHWLQPGKSPNGLVLSSPATVLLSEGMLLPLYHLSYSTTPVTYIT